MGAKIKNNSLRRLEKIHKIVTELKGKNINIVDALDDIDRLSDLNFRTRIRQSKTASMIKTSMIHNMTESEV